MGIQQERILSQSCKITITEEEAAQRVDNFLRTYLKELPKSRIYQMLRSGEVRLNGGRVKPTTRLIAGGVLRIPPVWRRAASTPSPRVPGRSLVQLLLASILYEDAALLVVNKPVGVAAHGGSGINFGVIEALRTARPEYAQLELVHRLDKETSGVMLLAKKRSALRRLHELIRAGKVSKKYWLLVHGSWVGGKQVVHLPLLKNQLSSGARIVTVNPAGKAATTILRPLVVTKEVSLLEAELVTGRTHQIRVHVKHLGYPLVGDEKYGIRQQLPLELGKFKRLGLHAHELSFSWIDHTTKHFKAPLDPDFARVVAMLKQHQVTS